MAALLALVGASIAGVPGAVVALGVALMWPMAVGQPDAATLLADLGAIELDPRAAPRLHALVVELAGRARLTAPPRLHVLPGGGFEALSFGGPAASELAMTADLVEALGPRALGAVIAHELSHIRHGDARAMVLAAAALRATGRLARLGLVAALVVFPILALADEPVPWPGALVLLVAPTLMALLHAALSRSRELRADADAVALTGDRAGLVEALVELDRLRRRRLDWVALVGLRAVEPSSPLASHPHLDARIRRLGRGAPPD